MPSVLARRSFQRIRTAALASAAALGILGGLLACTGTDRAAGPGRSGDLSPLVVSASVAGTSISTLVLTVSAADIPAPLVFNLEADPATGVAAGTLRIPAGDDRLISAQAFDASAEVTHEGSTTVDVARGTNPPLSLQLLSIAGEQPITLTVGSVRVLVTPVSPTVMKGETVQLAAEVLGPDDQPVPGATVQWRRGW
jgi:hypothetical protein